MDVPCRANREAYMKFLDRLCALVSRVYTIDDNAGYRASNRSCDRIRDNAERLRRTATLPYTPNDGVAEPDLRHNGRHIQRGLDSVGPIRCELKRRLEDDLINPVKFYGCTTVDPLRISPRKAAGIEKRVGPGEHFAYAKRGYRTGRSLCRPSKSLGRRRARRPFLKSTWDCPSRAGRLEHSGQLSCEASLDTACKMGRRVPPAMDAAPDAPAAE